MLSGRTTSKYSVDLCCNREGLLLLEECFLQLYSVGYVSIPLAVQRDDPYALGQINIKKSDDALYAVRHSVLSFHLDQEDIEDSWERLKASGCGHLFPPEFLTVYRYKNGQPSLKNRESLHIYLLLE